jgi:phosphocarrier protein HPr
VTNRTTPDDGSSVLSRELIIENVLGLHARPAAMLAKLASRFDCDISIKKDGAEVSAKSLMGLLSLEAARGTKLLFSVDGPDAEQAIDEITRLIESKFGENE